MKFIKSNIKYLLIIIIATIIFNIKLPYYIMAPGGIIKIDERIETTTKTNTTGSINLLYVTQYDGNISSLFLSLFMKNWDVEKLSTSQVSNETSEEIHKREKVMLDNSIQNAIFVAYQHANKEITITNKKNIVIATTTESDIKIGDEILKANDIEIENVNTLKEIINNTQEDTKIKLLINRDDELIEIKVPIIEQDNSKIIGIIVITNYEYELDPEINISFKSSEGGSSGGLMTAVSIYNAISETDITKGLNIGGTGTIDINGNVGEIDGVKYKIMGAVKNKLDIVFVPKNNYEEALQTKKENNYKIEIVSVSTFNDVIEYLKNYK